MGEARRRAMIADQPRREVPHDPDIEVKMTGDDAVHCFMVRLGPVRTYLHATSLRDLSFKLDEAFHDWQFEQIAKNLKDLGVSEDELRAIKMKLDRDPRP